MERRNRLGDMLIALPLAHQVVIGIAAVVLAMAAFLFFQWVSTPSYTVLYSQLDDSTLATVVDELDRQGVPYEIEAGGSRVLVPKAQVYQVRASLAAEGVQNSALPEGYGILEGQGLNVSDFRQRIDYQRALEGEMELTLLAMNNITAATVHLVLPEESLFAEDEEPVTASVLLNTSSPLGELEIETVTFLVASGVEGLTPENVIVADVEGNVLHAAGDIAAGSAVSNRNLRMTRDFEAALASDVRLLLAGVVGTDSASVVVRAQLDFDEQSIESQTYDEESAVPLRDSIITESYIGAGTPPGGTLGVDGETVVTDTTGDYTYDRSEVISEYGVDSVTSREVTAPGKVEQLSVAVVMDDGSLTGAPVPPIAQIESLITAAVGLDTVRGDSLSVSAVPYPVPAVIEEAAVAEVAPMDIMSMIPQIIGGLVLFIVMVALLLMARGGKKSKKGKKGAAVEADQPAALTSGSSAGGGALAGGPEGSEIQPEVMNLVQRQPEEIAVLLRSWLADRR